MSGNVLQVTWTWQQLNQVFLPPDPVTKHTTHVMTNTPVTQTIAAGPGVPTIRSCDQTHTTHVMTNTPVTQTIEAEPGVPTTRHWPNTQHKTNTPVTQTIAAEPGVPTTRHCDQTHNTCDVQHTSDTNDNSWTRCSHLQTLWPNTQHMSNTPVTQMTENTQNKSKTSKYSQQEVFLPPNDSEHRRNT